MATTGMGIDWFRYALSIGLVLLLLIGLLWVLRRLKSMQKISSKNNNLELLETINIGPRQKISLIRVGSNTVLVGITVNQFTALGSWSDVSVIKGEDFVA
jgi:flagellar biosynthetic protein FliO